MYYHTLRRIGGEILAGVTYFENARALLILKMVANMWSLVPNNNSYFIKVETWLFKEMTLKHL